MSRLKISIIFFSGFLTCYLITNYIHSLNPCLASINYKETYIFRSLLILSIHAIFLNTFSNDIKTKQ